MNKTLEMICGCLIWIFVIFVFCLMLSGCSRKTPVESAFSGVQQAIVETKQSLPTECQTSEVLAKFEELETKRQVAESVCEAKIKDTQIRWERTLWFIILVVGAYFVKFFIKK